VIVDVTSRTNVVTAFVSLLDSSGKLEHIDISFQIFTKRLKGKNIGGFLVNRLRVRGVGVDDIPIFDVITGLWSSTES
jgi:hypothetical protein